jgi:hypothetical protein
MVSGRGPAIAEATMVVTVASRRHPVRQYARVTEAKRHRPNARFGAYPRRVGPIMKRVGEASDPERIAAPADQCPIDSDHRARRVVSHEHRGGASKFAALGTQYRSWDEARRLRTVAKLAGQVAPPTLHFALRAHHGTRETGTARDVQDVITHEGRPVAGRGLTEFAVSVGAPTEQRPRFPERASVKGRKAHIHDL